MAGDIGWVCGNCRAINDRRSSRCYSCRAPRVLAVDPLSGISPIQAGDRTPPAQLASIARKAGATYRSSALRAIFVILGIVVVTGVHVARLGPLVGMFAIAQRLDAGQVAASDVSSVTKAAVSSGQLLIAEGGAWLLAFVAWGMWLSRVVANVPALGGGWTRSSAREAFLSSIVPVYNLFWMTAAVRDAVARLSPPRTARDGLVSAWWITLAVAVLPGLGLFPGPLFQIRLAVQAVGFVLGLLILATGIPITLTLAYAAIYTLLLIPAALLAFAVVRHIENLQSARVAALEPVRPDGAISAAPLAAAPIAVGAAKLGAQSLLGDEVRPADSSPLPDALRAGEHPSLPEPPELGPHAAEVEAFIESLGIMNRDEAGRVHRQGLASGAGGGSRWASLDRQVDSAAAASGLGPARLEAQRRATRASARSDARLGNRYVIADECAGVWAAVLVLRDHLPRPTAAMAFEPWEDVLVRPEWL
jgi:hypothetical protein